MIIDNKILKQNPLAEGGEGLIYECKEGIIKAYKDCVDKNEKIDKLNKLMSKNLPQNVVTPIDLVYDKNKKFIGYLMKKVDGEDLKKLSNKKFVQVNNIKIKDIAKILLQIKNTLIELHNQNIIISDLNDNNIIFDKNYNIWFIDADSWTIDNIKCTVCMDTFKDPLLVSNNFNNETDYYAFAILLFKSLTRIHPFGGTTTPDMDILERMKKHISVIDNKNVTIPRTVNKWDFVAPKLIKEVKEIFETKKRYLVDALDDFCNNLKECVIHGDYYYSKFIECPVCNSNAKIIDKPVKLDVIGNIPVITLFEMNDITTILNFNSYLTKDKYVVNRFSNIKRKLNYGEKIYYSDNGKIIYTISDTNINIEINNMGYVFNKINKSNIVVKNDKIYYVNLNNTLTELTITEKGNISKIICKVAFNNYFDVHNDKYYFVCNVYDNMVVLNIDGYMITINNKINIQNYGIHFDETTKRWLFIIEDDKGVFTTYIYDKNIEKFKTDSIKYSTNLSNICFNNKIIFKAGDQIIRGYSYEKNAYKDFPCGVVNEDSKLIRESNKFIVINEKEIYKVG